MNDLKIISSPIVWPKIQPTDWSAWWKIWLTEGKRVPKVAVNHNETGALWRGFDIYVAPGADPEAMTGYRSTNVNCPELFPSLFDNLDEFPMEIKVMRVVSSLATVIPHQDHTVPAISVRSMLYDNNFKPTFYYKAGDKTLYQTLPQESNTWLYWDNKSKHGTDFWYGHHKQLIVYYGNFKINKYESVIKESQQTFSSFIHYE